MRPVRVGGQALPDGVLMRTDRAWAIARHDGSVRVGDLPAPRLARIPVLRVLAGLGPALLLGLRGGGRGDQRAGRRTSWALLRGVAVAQLVVVAADGLATHVHLTSGWSPVVQIGVLVLAIGAFRLVTPAAQWRLHGAEHKAVAAHERGIDLSDLPGVLACSRVHPRCGTNIVVWAAVAVMWLGHISWPTQLAGSIVAIGAIAEVMSVAARHHDNVLARLLQAPGALVQRVLTTAEPTPADQVIGCRALVACLERHSATSGHPTVVTAAPK